MRGVTPALPVIPGQSEASRRFVQELQGSRHDEFVAAWHRRGIAGLTLGLAPCRTGDVALAGVTLATDLDEVEARLAAASQPFDPWFKARVHELHGVELRYGVARYLSSRSDTGRRPTPRHLAGSMFVHAR